MAVLLINPNSTESMTEAMLEVARQTAPELEFDGWTSHDGPPAIQGRLDGEMATAPLLALVEKANAENADGIIIGCFDDTALFECSETFTGPVLGIGQSAFHYAALRQWKFSVVTTLNVSVPVIEDNVTRLGLAHHLAQVRASDVAVLELEQSPDASEEAVINEAKRAEQNDGIDALVLGCAGMVKLTHAVRRSIGVEVIDPVVAAATCMRWMLQRT